MSKRPAFFTDTYTPGKKFGATRQVTVDGIPVEEVIHDGRVTDVHLTFGVAERLDVLVKRALRANDLQHQRIPYTETKRRGRSSVSRRRPVPASGGADSVPER